jgi:hypothetical protein
MVIEKSESTKSVEWDLAVGEEDETRREQGITLKEISSFERKRRYTTAGLLDEGGEDTRIETIETGQSDEADVGQVSISISVSSFRPSDATSGGDTLSSSGLSASPLSSPRSAAHEKEKKEEEKEVKHLYITKKNKSIRTIDTSFRKSIGSPSSTPLTASSNSSFLSNTPLSPFTPHSRHSLSPTTPFTSTPIGGYVTSYYDIAIPTTPIATPKASPFLSPSSPISFSSSNPLERREISFANRFNNGSEPSITSAKLFKNKYLLEFNNAALEEEYLAETRAQHIVQQRFISMPFFLALFIHTILSFTFPLPPLTYISGWPHWQ